MRSFFALIILNCLFFVCNIVFAQGEIITPPTISTNVHVLKNTTSSQCPSSWNGSGGSESMTAVSGYGMDTGIDVVGVLSCTSCTFDSNSRDCVCARCYGYYN